MSFRINMIMIVIMIILGWTFCKSVTYWVNGISNASRCIVMTETVKGNIEDRLLRVESMVKAGALTARAKRMTPDNAKVICDSIRLMGDLDTVYVAYEDKVSKEKQRCISMARHAGASLWSEPHKTKDSIVIVTFVTPLRNEAGRIYATLCADVKLDWLKQLAENGQTTENTVMTVTSESGHLIYHSDSTMIMKIDSLGMDNKKESEQDKIISLGNNTSYTNEEGSHATSSQKIERAGWTLRCSTPFRDSSDITIIISAITIILMILLFIAMAMSLIVTINWQLKPLTKIAKAADAVSRGNFHFPLPIIKGHTEIRELRDSFERMQTELEKYIDDLRKTTEQNAAMERDLHIAWHIQQGMLPKTFPAFPERDDLDIYGFLRPAKEIGGDIFDFFIREDKLFMLIGDVSGKGVPAALFMTVVGHLFRNIGRYTFDPVSIVSGINSGITEGNEQNMFCTLIVGVLDTNTGVLKLCNAGHNAPILIQNNNDTNELDVNYIDIHANIPTGVCEGFEYQPDEIKLCKSDVFFLYTDGLTEAENREQEIFGENSTLLAVREYAGTTMNGLSDGVRSHVKSFIDGNEQSDDFTILCLRYK